jgi:hypothetical protein
LSGGQLKELGWLRREVTDTEYAAERMSASRLCADAQLAEPTLKGATRSAVVVPCCISWVQLLPGVKSQAWILTR